MCSFTELVTNQSVGTVITDEQSPITFSPLDRKCTGEMRKVNSASMTSSLRDRNGKNSLAQLCRRFLMVLLCNPVGLCAFKPHKHFKCILTVSLSALFGQGAQLNHSTYPTKKDDEALSCWHFQSTFPQLHNHCVRDET